MMTRLEEIKLWLTSYFPNVNLFDLQYIQADASDRKYLRLKLSELSFIIMDTKPGPELENFIKINQVLAKHDVLVPEIINQDFERGLLLMSDLGSTTYLSLLKDTTLSTVNKVYSEALETLIKIQTIPYQNLEIKLPSMGQDYLQDRLNVFTTWYLQKHLNIPVDQKIVNLVSNLQTIFADAYQQFPATFVHLDYHSRNLMYCANGKNPGVLDFQDAMIGPPTYDLVSLFQDAYITWPRNQVEAWIQLYIDMATEAGILPTHNFELILKNFDLVGLQRHVKNLGVFARLHHRDNKSNYLKDIPTLLQYIIATCERYPELTPLLDFLKSHILEFTL